jgi:PST family polysaccharide transporter
MIQSGSLVILVPALVAGAVSNGIAGLAAAQAAVAVGVVLPLYLWQLSRHQISFRAVISAVWLPVLAAMTVGAFSFGLTLYMSYQLWTLPIAGLLAGGATTGLLFIRRRDIRALLNVGPVPVANAAQMAN